MTRERRVLRQGVCVVVAVLGLLVALPAVVVGFVTIGNGLEPAHGVVPPLPLSLLLATLLTPLVLSLLLFVWRLAGRWWAAWWLVVGLGVLADALLTAVSQRHGLGTLFVVPAAVWFGALLGAAAVVGLGLAQLWVVGEVARSRGWEAAPATPAKRSRWWALAPIGAWLILAAALVWAWGPPLPFDRDRWATCESSQAAWGDSSRARMAQDLIAHHLRPGMSDVRVQELLGDDDHPDIYALHPRPTLSQALLATARWGWVCPGLRVRYAHFDRRDPQAPRRVVRASIMGSYIGFTD
ncbi:MAG: hypothetical protein FJX74_15675 [Armatimonadetes bacterium]|nr:hypothetical protein [Armatimonadota bacterium]